MVRLLTLLFLSLSATGALLNVPEDFEEVQQAMDASAAGDTVVVARGTWVGLLQSPTHSLVLCSQFIFSQDSTDVNETILDAEFEGTLLTVNTTVGSGVFELIGLTLEHGQGQGENSVCMQAGAVHVCDNGNLVIRSSVIRDNASNRHASALFFALQCTTLGSQGYLRLENVYFENNRNDVDGNPSTQHGSIYIRSQDGRVELQNIRYNGSSATTNSPIQADISDPLAFSVNGIDAWDCDGGKIGIRLSSDGHQHFTIQNVKTYTTIDSLDGCSVGFGAVGSEERPFTCTWRGLDVSGVRDKTISMGGDDVHFRYEGIHIHDCSNTTESILNLGLHSAAGSSEITDLVFHHNTSGDSVDQVPDCMISLGNTDLNGAHLFSNHVVIPPDPQIDETGGHYLRRGSILRGGSSLEHLGNDGVQYYENLLFEDNFVDDLDDYGNLHPGVAPHENEGRELYFGSECGLFLSNLTIRNSRQPNHTPELYVPAYMTFSTSGSCVYLTVDRVEVKDVLLEDCDDGGFELRSIDEYAILENIVLRNVRRSGIKTGGPAFLRNVHVENVDAQDNYLYLTPENTNETEQSALYFIGGGNEGYMQNVTITGCDGIRRPIGFWPNYPAVLSISNTIIAGNTCEMLIEENGTISWSHCYVQEAVEGEGNLIGNDPLFDPERGIPFLAPDSPCIDAGHPDAAYNDLEDPDAPGFALWPSQGGLRNDIGCTGGPYANDSMFVSVAPARPITLPASPTLGDAYPNPFNPTTTIPFVIQQPTQLRLAVYNLRGQQIATLADDVFLPGEHRVTFDGSSLASGVYLISLSGEGAAKTGKMLLLK